jgi:hypothetical protein
MTVEIVSYTKPRWKLMHPTGDVDFPYVGKYVRFENGLTRAAKIYVCAQQPNLQIFA